MRQEACDGREEGVKVSLRRSRWKNRRAYVMFCTGHDCQYQAVKFTE